MRAIKSCTVLRQSPVSRLYQSNLAQSNRTLRTLKGFLRALSSTRWIAQCTLLRANVYVRVVICHLSRALSCTRQLCTAHKSSALHIRALHCTQKLCIAGKLCITHKLCTTHKSSALRTKALHYAQKLCTTHKLCNAHKLCSTQESSRVERKSSGSPLHSTLLISVVCILISYLSRAVSRSVSEK